MKSISIYIIKNGTACNGQRGAISTLQRKRILEKRILTKTILSSVYIVVKPHVLINVNSNRHTLIKFITFWSQHE